MGFAITGGVLAVLVVLVIVALVIIFVTMHHDKKKTEGLTNMAPYLYRCVNPTEENAQQFERHMAMYSTLKH